MPVVASMGAQFQGPQYWNPHWSRLGVRVTVEVEAEDEAMNIGLWAARTLKEERQLGRPDLQSRS